MTTYAEFLESKSQLGGSHGFAPLVMPDCLFDFQQSLVDWAIRKGRAAIFADTGLGKTIMELTFADNVVRHTNKPVLIFVPLAVAPQMVREGNKFGIHVHHSRDGKIQKGINITNYERLHYFNPGDFAGAIGDEIQACKAFDGKRRKLVTRFFSKLRFRLVSTATPAPNDYVELGTQAESLGVMTQSEMLSLFFRSSDKQRHSLFREGDFWNRQKWFFRPHAETPFWRWACSWARFVRKPSDLGRFDDTRFILPPLEIEQHVIPTTFRWPGELFVRIARTLNEQREERKQSMKERCDKVAALVAGDKSAVVWCQYNAEGDMLEKMIPGCVQVAGRHSDDEKEEKLDAFTRGQVPILVTKGKIAGLGLNWQHCGHQTFYPSHSFEGFYQSVRRSWRFGRVGPVKIDVKNLPPGVTASTQG